jgi:hypothetical protein
LRPYGAISLSTGWVPDSGSLEFDITDIALSGEVYDKSLREIIDILNEVHSDNPGQIG